MARFINDDFKLKNGGRNAARITIDELKEILHKYSRKYNCMDSYYDPEYPLTDESDTYDYYNVVLSEILDADDTLCKDRKYEFDLENFSSEPYYFRKNSDIAGFNTLDNGLTYIGFWSGGDWEYGVFGIVYYDGKKLRTFIPTYGNTVNRKSKCAISGDDDDIEALEQYEFDWDAECLDDKHWNQDAMLEEIKARIIVAA